MASDRLRFVDTNVLVYSVSTVPEDGHKRAIATDLLVNNDDLALSVQVLQEFYVQATRATRRQPLTHQQATELIRTWLRFPVQDLNVAVLIGALEIKGWGGISYWDAAIIAAARALGCREVLSEDMSHGRVIDGIRVTNPFR